MKFKTFIIAALIAASEALYKNYIDYKVYKINIKCENDVKVINDLNESGKWYFWSDNIRVNGDVRIMVSPEKEAELLDYLSEVNIESELLIENVQKLIEEQLRRPKNFNRNNYEYDWTYYQTLEEINDWLDDIVAKHSDVARIVSLGKSVENRDIRGVKIDFQKRDNPIIGVIEAGIHAREWVSPATATWIIKEFLESNDPGVRSMAENIVWHIFPVFNPDGYRYTFVHNRMWRKNRQTANHTSCDHFNIDDDFSNGVDLNRNFGFQWMAIGASQDACTEIFAGPVPYSEPETIGMVNYVTSLHQEGRVLYYISFHSYSQMLLLPYSHIGGSNVLSVPHYADMHEIAIKGMEKLKEVHGTEYIVGTSLDILYPVGGDSVDWAKALGNIPLAYLFELRDIGPYGFLLPAEQIIPNNEEIMAGLVEMDQTSRKLGFYHVSSAKNFGLNTVLMIFVFTLMI